MDSGEWVANTIFSQETEAGNQLPDFPLYIYNNKLLLIIGHFPFADA
jgi:hypothetical protein